jgi:hypothetical protein
VRKIKTSYYLIAIIMLCNGMYGTYQGRRQQAKQTAEPSACWVPLSIVKLCHFEVILYEFFVTNQTNRGVWIYTKVSIIMEKLIFVILDLYSEL